MHMVTVFDRRRPHGVILIRVLVSLATRPGRHPAGLRLLGLGAADARGRGGEQLLGLSHLPGDNEINTRTDRPSA
jgi:hypothetical protein